MKMGAPKPMVETSVSLKAHQKRLSVPKGTAYKMQDRKYSLIYIFRTVVLEVLQILGVIMAAGGAEEATRGKDRRGTHMPHNRTGHCHQ